MSENIVEILPELWLAMGQTLLMLGIGLSHQIVVQLFPQRRRCRAGEARAQAAAGVGGQGELRDQQNWTVNTVRSFPFIILLVALVPFTRWLAGTSIGPLAAAVPLSVAAIPYLARLVDQCLRDVPRGVIEAAHAMGASELQIVWRVLIVEARSGLVLALTVLAVSFLSYSAIAGVVGGGGIGDLAIRYGYYRFQTDVMVLTVTILVAMVQVIQFVGNTAARRLDKRG